MTADDLGVLGVLRDPVRRRLYEYVVAQGREVSRGEAAEAVRERSDVCAVPAAGVVAEAMVAIVLADAVLEKFGGDSVDETRRNLDGYLAGIARRGAFA